MCRYLHLNQVFKHFFTSFKLCLVVLFMLIEANCSQLLEVHSVDERITSVYMKMKLLLLKKMK